MDVAACNKQDDPDTQAPSVCVPKLSKCQAIFL